MALHARHRTGELKAAPVRVVSGFSEVVAEGALNEELARVSIPRVESFFSILAQLFRPCVPVELIPRSNGASVKLVFNTDAGRFAPNLVIRDENILISYCRAITHEFDGSPALNNLVHGFRMLLTSHSDRIPMFGKLAGKLSSSPYLAVYFGLVTLGMFFVPMNARGYLLSGVPGVDCNVFVSFYRMCPEYLDMMTVRTRDFMSMVCLQHRRFSMMGMP